MSKTATLNLRIDPQTKASAETVLNQLGMSMSTAVEVYLRQIALNGEILGVGRGRTKKQAEQAAARQALSALQSE